MLYCLGVRPSIGFLNPIAKQIWAHHQWTNGEWIAPKAPPVTSALLKN
jgi:hypothetical protein